jgi:hypothetical protein
MAVLLPGAAARKKLALLNRVFPRFRWDLGASLFIREAVILYVL